MSAREYSFSVDSIEQFDRVDYLESSVKKRITSQSLSYSIIIKFYNEL